MREVLTRLTATIGWNRAVLTEQALLGICADCKITVLHGILPERGVYFLMGARPFIGLDSTLSPMERWRVLAHEMGHHFLHTPGMWAATRANEDKMQFQANAFCAGALIPQPYLRALSFADLEREYFYPHDLITFRAYLWTMHRI